VAKVVRETLAESKDETKPDRKFLFLECGHLIVKSIPKGTPFGTLLSSDEKKPYPFQTDGMRFIEAALSINKGAAIFDEMGLGKTIQGLGYLKFHPERLPALFIVKSAIKFQWFKEILRWCGNDFLAQMISSSSDWLIPGLKCYIISYDMLVFKSRQGKNGKTIKQGFDGARFKELGIKTVILDECQQIKNPDAARTQEVRKICKDASVIAFSGTPWKNRGSEFYTVLNMLAPMKFPSYERFLREWVDYYWDGQYQKQGGIRRIPQFREYIKDIALRREISEVMSELPDVNRTLFFTELEKIEQDTYDGEVSEFVKWYNEHGDDNDFGTSSNILAKLARMRHITGLAKIPATVEFVETFIEETGRKICIFVHHKDVGEILQSEISSKLSKIPVFKLTADLDSLTRFQIQEKFNATECCVLVASTLASGEGINLQTCGDAILHERQWNPQNEDQAAPGRFRRIGSTSKQINVTFVTASGTVDEILANIVERKRGYFHNTMNKGEQVVWNQGQITKELAEGIVNDWNKKNKK
jgi:SNF2 family DNA or RNA helicase